MIPAFRLFDREHYLMNSCGKPTEQPFADDGGIKSPAVPDEDPYRTLDDLMVVVEALCPVWPPRDLFVTPGKMLL